MINIRQNVLSIYVNGILVIECLLITDNSVDYQLKLIVRDLDIYHQILLGKIIQITEFILVLVLTK